MASVNYGAPYGSRTRLFRLKSRKDTWISNACSEIPGRQPALPIRVGDIYGMDPLEFRVYRRGSCQ
jgi:hypothetical protein